MFFLMVHVRCLHEVDKDSGETAVQLLLSVTLAAVTFQHLRFSSLVTGSAPVDA